MTVAAGAGAAPAATAEAGAGAGEPAAGAASVDGGGVHPRLARGAGAAGLVFAALFVAAFGLLRVDAPPADPVLFDVWWEASEDRIALGTYLVPFAAMSFIWFVAAVRARIGRAEGLFFSTLFIGGALVYVAMMCASAAAVGSILAAEALGPISTQLVATMGHALAHALFFGFAVKLAAMFMLAVASIGRGGRTLPPWLTLATIVAGVAALVGNTFLEVIALIFPAWVVVISVLLLRAGAAAGEAADPAAAGA